MNKLCSACGRTEEAHYESPEDILGHKFTNIDFGGLARRLKEELLPCPFCNGEYVRRELSPHTSKPVLEELAEDSGGGWRVCCYGCRVQTWNGLSKEEAIETWNRRIPQQKANE